MEKIRFLLLLLTIPFIFSCNDEIIDSSPSPDLSIIETRDYTYAYKLKPDNSISTRSASLDGKEWDNEDTIRIKFLNGTTLVQNKVKEVAAEWLKHANLEFTYVSTSEDADVKIAFSWNNDYITWSTIGIDCKNVAQNEPSMNLTLFDLNDVNEINTATFTSSILREFGHVLGLLYENQGSNSPYKWDQTRVKKYFFAQGWTQSQIEDLLRVYSKEETNFTDFDSESIMLVYFPAYLTTDNRSTKLNTKLSPNDIAYVKLLYPGEIPNRIELTYKQNGDPNSYPYTAVRIGEYYWINNNFYHKAPNLGGGAFWVGGEPDVTEAMMDTYMKAIHMDLNKKNNPAYPNFPNQLYNLDNFNRYYGRHYNIYSTNYMDEHGRMYDGAAISPKWELPSTGDYKQLFAMSPFVVDPNSGILHVEDVIFALSAKYGDNPAIPPYYVETHGDNLIYGEISENKGKHLKESGKTAYHAIYFNNKSQISNLYGFNMMPGGARGNASWGWENGLYNIETINSYSHNGVDQYLRQVLYTAIFRTKNREETNINDYIDSNMGDTYHLLNIRWCRKLTDRELGYKLYINSDYTDIKKLKLKEVPPTGYTELVNSYLRGFYVQYILNNPSPKYTVRDLVEFSKKVQDRTLPAGQPYY